MYHELLKKSARPLRWVVFLYGWGPLYCSFLQQHELRRLKTSEPRPKQKKRRPEPRKHTEGFFGYLGVFKLDFFGTMRLFWKFLDCIKGSPRHLFRYFATDWILKNLPGSPSTFFGTVTLFKYLIFNVSKGSPFHFFIFCYTLFKKPNGYPLSQL